MSLLLHQIRFFFPYIFCRQSSTSQKKEEKKRKHIDQNFLSCLGSFLQIFRCVSRVFFKDEEKNESGTTRASVNVIKTRIKSNYSYIKDVRNCFFFREVSVCFLCSLSLFDRGSMPYRFLTRLDFKERREGEEGEEKKRGGEGSFSQSSAIVC